MHSSTITSSYGGLVRLGPRAGSGLVRRVRSLPARLQARSLRLVRWSFYLFVLSIPLEYPPRDLPFEVHTITGALFLLTTVFHAKACYGRTPNAVRWLGLYLALYLVLSISPDHPGEMIHLFLNMLQAAFLFWAGYNLMLSTAISKAALLCFVIGCALVAVLQVSGIGRNELDVLGTTQRFTVLGQDPNTVSANMALSLLACFGLTHRGSRSTHRWRRLFWPVIALLGVSLALTGSRGGLLALAVGIFVYSFRQGRLPKLAKNTAVAALLVFFVFWLSMNTTTMRERSQQTIQERTLAGREEIYPLAWEMFLERPLTGWGPVDNLYELGRRTKELEIGKRLDDRQTRDTHNVVLEILTATGILGAIPFFACVWLCVRGAWRARALAQDILPLMVITTVLILNMSINWVASKQSWVFFALALASGTRTYMADRRLRPVRARRRAGERSVSRRNTRNRLAVGL